MWDILGLCMPLFNEGSRKYMVINDDQQIIIIWRVQSYFSIICIRMLEVTT